MTSCDLVALKIFVKNQTPTLSLLYSLNQFTSRNFTWNLTPITHNKVYLYEHALYKNDVMLFVVLCFIERCLKEIIEILKDEYNQRIILLSFNIFENLSDYKTCLSYLNQFSLMTWLNQNLTAVRLSSWYNFCMFHLS